MAEASPQGSPDLRNPPEAEGPAQHDAAGSLRDRRLVLVARRSLQGRRFCEAYATEADTWLASLAGRASGGRTRHLALLGVGGYGRRELCPFSDLDLVLVHEGHGKVADLADAIWYPVWDEGIHLDHSVRRPSEVLQVAGDDLRVALGLLDARLVWGEAGVGEPLVARARGLWQRRLMGQWLGTLESQMDERRSTHGDLAFLLEPDLKEAHGGLRDAAVLHALHTGAPALAQVVNLDAVARSVDVLLGARVELHRGAGRALDRLALQEQDQVAAALGYADADVLMAAVSEAGRTIAWACDDAWRRRRRWAPDPGRASRAAGPAPDRERPGHPSTRPERRRWLGRGRRAPDGEAPPVPVEPGIAVVESEVAIEPTAPVGSDSSLPLRVAAVAAERDLPVARGALRQLADKAPPPAEPWPPETREALVRVLLAGHRSIDPLEALDQAGLLVRLLPEWAPVRHRPQRNAYHRFTVDRHLLEAAANAADLVDRVPRPDLLVVGTLLHDIGKGYPGDHTDAGVALVERIARRMGFGEADVATLVSMCRLHLLLPDTATRRDLDDPTTIETVSAAVGDETTLRLLWALTEADSLATGPSAWGTWKAGLVAELAQAVSAHLAGAPPSRARRRLAEDHDAMAAAVRTGGRPLVRLEPPRVVVVAPDRPGLLASVAGTLALHGLDVRSADVSGGDGVATETFTVEVARGGWPDSDRLRHDLEAVLSDRLVLEDRLAAKALDYAAGRRPQRAYTVQPSVVVDNEASATSTVVEVRAPDELGLLHRVTRSLFDCGLDVVSARVSTIGDVVVDAFYVRDAAGAKVRDPGVLSALTDTLLTVVGPSE